MKSEKKRKKNRATDAPIQSYLQKLELKKLLPKSSEVQAKKDHVYRAFAASSSSSEFFRRCKVFIAPRET
jgi:hypothetical protein